MFCPVCRDEYRSGFTRCGTCEVALVERLESEKPRSPGPILAEAHAHDGDVPAANYCGFLTLDEARDARNKLRAARLPAEILIKDAPKASQDAPAQEEFWLRVRPTDFHKIVALIGFEPADTPADAHEDEDSFLCSACGATVRASDDACPGCGLRFEE